MRWATRWVSTRVFPLPAPASTRSGPSVVRTASRWGGFKASINVTLCPPRNERLVIVMKLELEIIFLGGFSGEVDDAAAEHDRPPQAILQSDILLVGPGQALQVLQAEVSHIGAEPRFLHVRF